MRLGILGGSFNPVHCGHLAVARAARDAHRLDRVLFVPAGRPPHKREELAPPEHRLAMVRLAIEGIPEFAASDIETARRGTTYTVDTLEELRRREPGAELFFVMGEDSVAEFWKWKEPERILALARVVVVNRPGAQGRFLREEYPGVPESVLDRIERDRVFMADCPIEARAIRDAVRSGASIEGMVPPRVAEYIAEHGLYRGAGASGRPVV
ncbi:MAG: nicotinate-nucleotide adenylyltransferase [Planctomycetota bacterium]